MQFHHPTAPTNLAGLDHPFLMPSHDASMVRSSEYGMTLVEMLRFGSVMLDVSRGRLRDRHGAEVALRPKSLDLLLALARNPGRVLSRDELFDAVWPDVTVTEDSIAQCVREVRRAIGDPQGRILRTIIKRGYCLDVPDEDASLGPAQPKTTTESDRPSLVSCHSRASRKIQTPNGSRTGLWRRSPPPCPASAHYS